MRPYANWIPVACMAILGAAFFPGLTQAAAPKNEPAVVQEIPGSSLHRLILQARAAERLEIKTTAIKMVDVGRKRTVAAEVFNPYADLSENGGHTGSKSVTSDGIWFKVLPIWDAAEISRDQAARVLSASSRDTFEPQSVIPLIPPKAKAGTLYYFLKNSSVALLPKHRVLVELSYKTARRLQIPLSAMFYDASGGTWVYEMVAPLTYVRHAVRIAYVEGDIAFLDEGPAENAHVVAVGAPLLQGIEFKVGH
jgi:hypothetical protein